MDESATDQGLQTIYANTAGVRGGPFDVAVQFGYAIGPVENDEEPATSHWLMRVAMSWEHARAFHRLLGEQIDKYEEQVGPIPNIEKLRVEEANP